MSSNKLVMVLVKATEDSEKGILPTTELLEAMGRSSNELSKGERIAL